MKRMKIMQEGTGGREDSLLRKIGQSPFAESLYCAPGNGGISRYANLVPIDVKKGPAEVIKLHDFAAAKGIGLIVSGREIGLKHGLGDDHGDIPVFGMPSKPAQLETSKAFMREHLSEWSVPIAPGKICNSFQEASSFIYKHGVPIVIKGDGLFEGKGVQICDTFDDALKFLDWLMKHEEGRRVILEDNLKGQEASYQAIVSGRSYLPLLPSQDHKAFFVGNKWLNTGGMGAYAPAPVITPRIEKIIQERILEPVINGMADAGMPCYGVIYLGLMIVEGYPVVLEINVRFGDPEIQPIMMLLKTDLVPILYACARRENLFKYKLEWEKGVALCVVMASKGYPENYDTQKGKVISTLALMETLRDWNKNQMIFHAGTAIKNGEYIINGGRVLNLMGKGMNIWLAKNNAYDLVKRIQNGNCDENGQYLFHCRMDIGDQAIAK